MKKTRTLVLMATMRSPTIGSPDQTHLRALLRREAPTSASDRTPIFPHARASRPGPLNMAIHRIAVTQIRHPGPGRKYYQQRSDSGDSKAAALRALKRRIARAVFHNLCIDQRQKQLGQQRPERLTGILHLLLAAE